MATVTCASCGEAFEPTGEQRTFIDRARANGMRFIMLECPNCGLSASHDPLSGEPPADEAPGLRCPVSRCTGWVVHVEDLDETSPFWGCGECGSQWQDERILQAEIAAIVARFPYRRKSYVKRGKRWAAAAPEKEPAGYEERVEKEPDGTGDSFVRG